MINVPQEVKEALHQDTCPKNIRIHFPNGERSDINNDMIVKDSVSFKESLCSQSTLKFGLCESPVFECEVVGVGNIKGASIEVSCEVYVEPWVAGAEFKVDIQKYVYSIPYGTFTVHEAKRQADMIHRKIIAYGLLSESSFGFTTMQRKRAMYRTVDASSSPPKVDYTQNIMAMISEKVQSNAFEQEETELTALDLVGGYSRQDMDVISQTTWWLVYRYYIKAYKIEASNSNKLYRIECGNPQKARECYGFGRLIDIQGEGWVDNFGPGIWGGKYIPTSAFQDYASAGVPLFNPDRLYAEEWGTKFVYPYMSIPSNDSFFASASNGVYLFVVYKKVRESWFRDPDEFYNWRLARSTETDYCDPSDVHMYVIDPTDSTTYTWAREIVDKTGGYGSRRYSVPNVSEINLRDIFNSYVELRGLFCGVDRYNHFKMTNIKRQFGLLPDSTLYPGSQVYPQAVTGGKLLPNDYQSCWYDDDYMMPFGKITVKFKDDQGETVEYIGYLPGYDDDTDINTYQTYDVNGNAIISNHEWTRQQIASLLSIIATNIEGVTFMPVDFVGRGLPYVEAGDTFEILTKSNDSITTIVLNRIITGEQTLTDSYKSV